jgi:hypothetical protein
MPRKIETIVYRYKELSDAAKEKARDWYRENVTAGCNDFAEFVTSDFHETLKALGFDVYERRGSYLDPRDPRANCSTVEWSGFGNQGDGAAFSGSWRASDFKPDALLKDRPVTFKGDGDKVETSESNKELHRIASEIRACVDAGMESASITSSHRGFFMRLNDSSFTEESDPVDCDDTNERFIGAARDLARAFYKALEAEYDYQNSDEQVAESIEAGGYEFTAEGRRA